MGLDVFGLFRTIDFPFKKYYNDGTWVTTILLIDKRIIVWDFLIL